MHELVLTPLCARLAWQMPLMTRLLNGDQGGGRALDTSQQALEAALAELGEGFLQNLNKRFNESQVQAIKAAVTNQVILGRSSRGGEARCSKAWKARHDLTSN